ncbi:hypothetical protein KIN20_004340 [Parelaphostrongylus tenuis]|uniref:Uncharacterized protein n=1 Tax=Parelaphostrongylus tenuis TaxID=148309 RepID=A0AAD5MJM5_PARTN|nr:hypothetical protein KIN20_004340 [Parelaphostrongylus tenuis]
MLAAIVAVFGCEMFPAGQVSTRNLAVTGFTMPIAMVHSTAADAVTRFLGIATVEVVAKGFVERLVMQTVLGVLESQAGRATPT